MANKKLGIGLDILLNATQGQTTETSERILTQGKLLFEQAWQQDEKGNSFEAYHLYRQVIDLWENTNDIEIAELVSRSCNNIAVILEAYAQTNAAISFLQRALDIYPQNSIARDNMILINNDD